MTKLLEGKKGIILGVANDKSIAWGAVKELSKHGARLALSYPNEAIKKRVTALAEEASIDMIIQCDVTKDEEIISLSNKLEQEWGSIDFVIHSVAFCERSELKGSYVSSGRQNFLQAMDISCYSFTAVANHLGKIMKNGGSMITMSYYGAEKVVSNYNVMGVCKAALEASVRYLANDLGRSNIRVNAISSGAIKTLASSAINGFKDFLKINEKVAPLNRLTTIEDVGRASTYLVSELSSGTTGEVLHVDCGYNIIGMTSPENLAEIFAPKHNKEKESVA